MSSIHRLIASKPVSGVIAGLMRCWARTLDIELVAEAPATDPRNTHKAHIYSLWHETILFPAIAFANCGIHVLVSQSKDGEMIAQVIHRLGFKTIRGSTKRGAVQALRELLRSAGTINLAITPDGPRGPRRVLQEGIVYLASRTGLPIVPAGHAFERPWRASSWDRLAIPRPFTRSVCYLGHPIAVPASIDRDELGEYQQVISCGMARATALAEARLNGAHMTRSHAPAWERAA